MFAVHGRPINVLYALVASISACCATPSFRCSVPVSVQLPAPKPVTVMPGLTITSALMVPAELHETDWLAKIPALVAAPRFTSDAADTFTVALPVIPPLVARTLLLYAPTTAPAVKTPVLRSMVPPPTRGSIDQAG